MDHQIQERVQKTLDFIQKDREIPEDPWFYSRLKARMEKEIHPPSMVWTGAALLRLKPLLFIVLILVSVAIGIVLGRVLSFPKASSEQTLSGFTEEKDATVIIFNELSGSMEEQILLMK